MNRVARSGLLAAILAASLAGCMNSRLMDLRRENAERARETVEAIAKEGQPPLGLVEVDKPSELEGAAERIRRGPEAGEISITGSGRMGDLLRGVAARAGYSVVFAEGADSNRPVTVAIQGSSSVAALRRIAVTGGYATVVDDATRTVTVSDQAVHTFKLPVQAMQQLESSFSVGGNPLSGSGGSSSGSSGSGGSGGTSNGSGGGSSIKAEFTANGKFSSNPNGLTSYLSGLAGANAQVTVAPDIGVVSVRANGLALQRMRDFLNKFAENAMRRIEIRTSIVEVALDDAFRYGIDWTRVLSGGTVSVSLSGADSVNNPALSINVAKTNITGVINSLRTYAQVRVITQPTITAMNRRAAVIFDGVQLPYLGSVTTTATQTSTSTAGSTSYAVSGVTLSIQPEILSDREAQLTLIPVLSDVREFKSFRLGVGTELTAPVQTAKQSLMNVLVESGKTVILGGIRFSAEKGQRDGILPVVAPWLAPSGGDENSHREVVILLQAIVVPSQRYETLFAESL